jgi:transposase
MYHIDMIYTIKTLLNKGLSQRAVALQLGISRKTVKKYCLQIHSGDVKEPVINKSKTLDQFKDIIADWYKNGLNAQLIFERLKSLYSIKISYPTVSRFVKELKTLEVFIPLISKPGEEAQVDYGYMGKFIKDGKEIKVWCFVITLSYSRLQYVEMVTNQSVMSFLKSHQNAFEFFGGTPQTIKIDNLKAGVIHTSFYEPQIQTQYAEFLEYYGSAPITARVRRPQDKGKVESGVKFVENNFLKNLDHKDFYRLEKDIKKWIEKANQRVHGTTKKVPLEQFNQIEKQQLIPLPDVRFELYNISKRRANNYAHIVFENNYYSVPCIYARKELLIKYTENILKIFDNQTQIALHAIDKGQGNYVTQEHHKPIEKQYKSKEYYLEKVSQIGAKTLQFSEIVIQKKPYEYQRIINGLCHLAKKHGNNVVNNACERSLTFGAISYLSIKNICEKNIDINPREELSVQNAGGFFQDLSIYDNLNFN